MKMKKILITGGVGFIGYHLVKFLLQDGQNRIVVVDNLQRGKLDDDFSSLLQNPHLTFMAADVTDFNTFEFIDKDFDQVYHLAAVNGTKWFYKMPQEVLRINTLSLVYVLEWIRKLEKKPKLCFTSSNEAYASALSAFGKLPIPTPENVPLVVEDTYNPRWSYGGSKLLGELFVIHYAQAYNFSALIVRPHNFYGPRAGYDHVIPEFCKKIISRNDPFMIFSPEETRTFCYINDAVKAMQLLMDSNITNNQPIETVHIGNNDEIAMRDLVEKMFSIIGWRPKEFDIRPSLPGSVKRRLADISKIKGLVGWQPETSLEDGLKWTYEWYQAHPLS